jgi:hypothetical protein
MRKTTYKFHYFCIGLINRFGFLLPNFLLFRWKFYWITEKNATLLLDAECINIDQFDIYVDRQIALGNALRKKRGK